MTELPRGGKQKPHPRDRSLGGGQRPLNACPQALKWDFIFFEVARVRRLRRNSQPRA